MSLAAYARLAELAERELELAREGRLDELEALAAERAGIVAGLPDDPPAPAQQALERCSAFQAATTELLARARAELARDAEQIDRGRRTARGYGAPPRSSARIDLSG